MPQKKENKVPFHMQIRGYNPVTLKPYWWIRGLVEKPIKVSYHQSVATKRKRRAKSDYIQEKKNK